MPHVVVVGAGPAGLAAAFRLTRLRPDVDVTVLEAGPRPGGNVGTVDRGGFRVEIGPNGFLDSKPGTLELCRDLGIASELIAASEGSRKNRYVYHAGRVQKLPGGPLDLLTTPLLSVRGKLELLAEPLRARRPTPDESVAAFARRRLGKEAASVFMDALVTGVHAADWERLSVASAFPRLPEFEAEHGSLFRGFLASSRAKKAAAQARGETPAPTKMWSFRGGLQRLVDVLAADLGPRVRLHAEVTRVTRSSPGWAVTAGRDEFPADALILTQPAPAAAAVLAAAAPELAADLAGIIYSPVAVVALGYDRSGCKADVDGFGYIAPPSAGRPVLGVQWCSAIFPDRAPDGCVLWRALCGGAKRPDVYALPDAELIRVVTAEMRHAMKVTADPVFAHVVRWPKAIPHYTVGHVARTARIRAAVDRLPGVFLAGNAVGGVALNDVTAGAADAAARVARFLPPAAG